MEKPQHEVAPLRAAPVLAGCGGVRDDPFRWRALSETVPDGWAEIDGALEREFTFDTFPIAIAFVNAVARLAQRENHHPDIRISYRNVTLRWVTHSAGGITDRDRDLAVLSANIAG